MADRQDGPIRSGLSYTGGGNTVLPKRDHADQTPFAPGTGKKSEVEDLGTPPMGWMPGDQIMAIVQQLDAELKAKKGA